MVTEDKTDEGTNTKAMAAAAGATAPGTESGSGPAKTENMVPQSRLDEYAKKVRELEKREAERAKAEADAEEKRLREQGEWKKLAETNASERDALKPKAQLADDLSAFVNETIDAEVKDWPEEVKGLVPEADDVRSRMAEVRKLRPLALKLSTAEPSKGSHPPGTGRKPEPKGVTDPAKAAEGARDVVASNRIYSL